MKAFALALALALAALPGCASVTGIAVNDGRPEPYGGAVLDVFVMGAAPYLAPVALVDLPLSFTLDTLLLPWALASGR